MAFSKMGLGKGDKDVSYKAHETFYDVIEEEEHDAGIVENVPSYKEEHPKRHLSKDWDCKSEVLDPRCFGHGAARPRRYILVWNTKKVQFRAGMDLTECVECLRERPQVSAESYFWMDLPKDSLTDSQELLNQTHHCLIYTYGIGKEFTSFSVLSVASSFRRRTELTMRNSSQTKSSLT